MNKEDNTDEYFKIILNSTDIPIELFKVLAGQPVRKPSLEFIEEKLYTDSEIFELIN